ncbi:MAG: L-rhamnose isomerase [Oscillospiraceae bacterium]|jgi:L-rhamnose isomerase|nr:L-rhamnose isomerase [Oscillospiraceae bacterium]
MSEYLKAKDAYAGVGVDTEAALRTLSDTAISIHCWQGDDVIGFEHTGGVLSGGIQTTGQYPGRARNPEELMADFDKAASLIPGKKRINLHANYAIFDGAQADRDALQPEHFAQWVDFARARGLGIDFNPTFFSHPMVRENLTLSSPDRAVRDYWVRHGVACRRIASHIAGALGMPVLNNIWVPDGYKDTPADRLGPRLRLRESLDRIFEEPLPGVVDSVESKVFGIGLEAYTVGSSEFCIGYAAGRPGVYNLLDSGHYHPTEMISDKISSMLTFFDKLPLHVSRPVRWDSDHVVRLDDEVREIAREIVRNDALERVLIGLDFFDASINRIAAWVIGTRNMQKALLLALLEPAGYLRTLQEENRFTELLMLQEELKTFPFGAVWDEWCTRSRVPVGAAWFSEVQAYEQTVLRKRG